MVAGMGIFPSGMNMPDHFSFTGNNAQFAKTEGSLHCNLQYNTLVYSHVHFYILLQYHVLYIYKKERKLDSCKKC